MLISPRGHAPLLVALLALGVAGCGTFRLHDPGRMQTASDAAKLAADLGRGASGPFGPMEQNLDEVQSTQARLRRLSEAHERETFLRILARLDADMIADRLSKAMQNRQTIFEALEARRAKLRELIALKLLTGEDVAFERAEVASLDVEINDLRDLLTQLRASRVVVSAPSPAEIQAASGLLDQIVGLAARDAATSAGLALLSAGLTTARDLRQKVVV